MGKAKTPPTFEVRFIGPKLTPETIPLRAVSDALSALQDLASGRDPFETQHVPSEKSIGLVKVSNGSAVYSLVSRAPDEARTNLGRVGRLLSSDTEDDQDSDTLITALRPIESLSQIATTGTNWCEGWGSVYIRRSQHQGQQREFIGRGESISSQSVTLLSHASEMPTKQSKSFARPDLVLGTK
jgi:hypothetical protein